MNRKRPITRSQTAPYSERKMVGDKEQMQLDETQISPNVAANTNRSNAPSSRVGESNVERENPVINPVMEDNDSVSSMSSLSNESQAFSSSIMAPVGDVQASQYQGIIPCSSSTISFSQAISQSRSAFTQQHPSQVILSTPQNWSSMHAQERQDAVLQTSRFMHGEGNPGTGISDHVSQPPQYLPARSGNQGASSYQSTGELEARRNLVTNQIIPRPAISLDRVDSQARGGPDNLTALDQNNLPTTSAPSGMSMEGLSHLRNTHSTNIQVLPPTISQADKLVTTTSHQVAPQSIKSNELGDGNDRRLTTSHQRAGSFTTSIDQQNPVRSTWSAQYRVSSGQRPSTILTNELLSDRFCSSVQNSPSNKDQHYPDRGGFPTAQIPVPCLPLSNDLPPHVPINSPNEANVISIPDYFTSSTVPRAPEWRKTIALPEMTLNNRITGQGIQIGQGEGKNLVDSGPTIVTDKFMTAGQNLAFSSQGGNPNKSCHLDVYHGQGQETSSDGMTQQYPTRHYGDSCSMVGERHHINSQRNPNVHHFQGPWQTNSTLTERPQQFGRNTCWRPEGNDHSYQAQNSNSYSHRPIARSSDQTEPRARLPEYNGKGEFAAFWMKFSLMADQFGWNEDTMLRKLMFSLYGEALDYVSRLPQGTRERLSLLQRALDHRFGDHVLPETHRATLQNIKKQSKETLREYEARVRKAMSHAYPGMEGTEMYSTLAVEYLVTGLPDPSMVFDILTKKPRTIEEALNLIEWYDCCKQTSRRKNVGLRQISEYKMDPEMDGLEVRRIGGKRFVTEERLHQFGTELQEKLVAAITGVIKQSTKSSSQTTAQALNSNEIKYSTDLTDDDVKSPVKVENRRKSFTDKPKTCYRCGQIGHFARECKQPAHSAQLREILEEPEVEEDEAIYMNETEN